jgi:hypothetical protein
MSAEWDRWCEHGIIIRERGWRLSTVRTAGPLDM